MTQSIAASPISFLPQSSSAPRSTPLKKLASQIAVIWQNFCKIVIHFFRWILDFIIYNEAQRAVLHKIRHFAKRPENTLIDILYFNDLKKQIGLAGRDLNPTALLKSIDQTAQQLENLAAQAEKEIASIKDRLKNGPTQELIEESDQLYTTCMDELKRLKKWPGTEVQRALYSGRLTTLFRELDDAFSDQKGVMMHRYCGCHIAGENSKEALKKSAPTLETNFMRDNYEKFAVTQPAAQVRAGMPEHPTALLLSQSFGGGHNVVQQAMSQRIAEQKGHAYKIEADEEVLEPYYQFKKWTRKSGNEWSQLLLQGNYFRTIRFLGWLSSGEKKHPSTDLLVHHFALSMLSRGKQDVAMMLFSRHAKGAEEAANHLGMGFANIETDLGYELFGFKHGASNPHFRHVLMARDPLLEAQGVGRVLEKHQLVEGGFPVREPFLKKYSTQEMAEIRTRHNQQYDLAKDARVVILLCGEEGVQNGFAEALVASYAQQKNAPKVHLFAVCGNNAKKKEKLASLFKSVHQEKLRATALGFVTDIQLGELFAMATCEKDKGLLISAKAGGGTLSEAVATGIPLLACDMSQAIQHEKANLDFIAQRNLGALFSTAQELPSKVVTMLNHPLKPKTAPDGTSYADFHSKEKSLTILSDLIKECRQDRVFQEKQQKIFKGTT